LVLAAIAGVSFYSPVAEAQEYMASRPGGRGGTWEFSLPLIYSGSTTWNGQGGSSVDLDATWGFGFGFGYNFNEHFQLNGLFAWSARNYSATIENQDGTQKRYGNTLYSSTFSLNGVYYPMLGKISPFVSGGIGGTYIDTSIPTSIGSTACWWDPWYGYVCGSTATTKTESDFSYNVGIGVRFDLGREFSLQPSYNKVWIDRGSKGTPDMDIWRMDFIFRM
jgi:opacity protein-like surface antigen